MRRNTIMLCVVSLLLAGKGRQPPIHVQDPQEMIGATCLLLYAAVVGEDAGVLQALLYAPGDPDQRLAAAHARRIIASVQLRRSLKGKESPALARLYERLRVVDGSEFLSFLMADWQVARDRAVGKLEELEFEKERIPPLINVRGIWKVNLLPDGPMVAVEALAAAVDKQRTQVEKTVAAFSQGNLRTIAEIEASLGELPQFAPSDYEPDIVLVPVRPKKQ